MSEDDRPSLWLRVERYGPAIAGVVALGALLYWATPIAACFKGDQWKSAGLYSAIFGWAAIQTGFAFGVYGFVVGKSGGFIGALRGTRTLARFEGYIRRANWTGFALTFATIPLIVTEPSVAEPLSRAYVVVAVWFAFFIWTLLAFFRLAYSFGTLASVKDKEFHGA